MRLRDTDGLSAMLTVAMSAVKPGVIRPNNALARVLATWKSVYGRPTDVMPKCHLDLYTIHAGNVAVLRILKIPQRNTRHLLVPLREISLVGVSAIPMLTPSIR